MFVNSPLLTAPLIAAVKVDNVTSVLCTVYSISISVLLLRISRRCSFAAFTSFILSMKILSREIRSVVATALVKEVLNPGLALASAADNPVILCILQNDDGFDETTRH